jgi:hypothetical protein
VSRKLAVTWRDESYGALCGVAAAFRLYETVDLDDPTVAMIHVIACRAGFAFHQGRCSWIAYDLRAAHTFVDGLRTFGLEAQHEGRWSELPQVAA